ncbi:acyltransferase [Sphingomonas sp. Leaf412]|nr:acyltransferase [Sphingomonas sp. Leaf412]
MEVRRDDPDNPALAGLLAEHVAEQRGNVPPGFAFALDTKGLADPAIAFWSAWDGNRVAGFGALKELDAATGEVKSMRSDAAYLGRGVGHALLSTIVAEARARGYARLYLETGTTPAYDAALTLYRRAGFVACDAFADYRPSPHNQFLSLDLSKEARCPPSS